jgi:cytochrome c553
LGENGRDTAFKAIAALAVTVEVILAALAAASAQTPADPRPPDTMAARVAACAPCHGAQGQGTSDVYFPRIAGKPAGYLFNQLQAFRVGRRKYPPMNYLLEFLPEAYLHEIADHFAGLRPPLPPPDPVSVAPDALRLGESLVTRGDAARNIPACVSCHGPSLTGLEPGIPALIGLRAKYISAQLGAFRYGTRTAPAPDCMQIVAAHLTENDVIAVAAWLASRPAPQNLAPAAKGSFALPFACGSQPS